MLTTKLKPKKCRGCSSAFMPVRPTQVVCGLMCGLEVGRKKRLAQEAKAARADRAETRKKLEAHEPIRKLIARAQVSFNAFIRARDKEKGCFVCGRPFLEGVDGRVQHAGHVRSRGAADHLRFNEDNVHGECEGCNGPHGAKPHQIKAGAIARIGQERYDALEADNDVHKWQRDEVIEIKKTYAAKCRELKKEM